MTCYFYTDPLAAAWMAKHFGMRFILSNLEEEISDWEILSRLQNTRVNTHPDSVKLLEPQVGDLVWLDMGEGLMPSMGTLINDETNKKLCSDCPIIQRNGIAFMWPEIED